MPAEQHESRPDRERKRDRNEGDKRSDRLYPTPHLGRVVEAWKRLFRFGNAEELAQRLSTLFHVVDQQTFWRDAAFDLLVVPLEDLDGVSLILEASVKGALPD